MNNYISEGIVERLVIDHDIPVVKALRAVADRWENDPQFFYEGSLDSLADTLASELVEEV